MAQPIVLHKLEKSVELGADSAQAWKSAELGADHSISVLRTAYMS